MHHHGYLWTGPKSRFDDEALRRPPYPEPPPHGSRPELVQRYREVSAEFATSDLPPIETAHWLLKPAALIRGTWDEPGEAAEWIARQLTAHALRFDSRAERDPARIAARAASAAARLAAGGDISLGHYLQRPVFLSLAVLSCGRGPAPCPRTTGTRTAGTPGA
ncbi:hypothetical protein ACIP88_20090 [Streptomyces uncialis]|uniref:hypothetical protein n=1 Tax=Streptomyces uncialis TaxID=1048205 RepID=UPI00380DBCDE